MSTVGRVTVVVPAYNEADRFDTEAFERFVAGRPRLSLLLVDDGSSDATLEVLQQLAQRLPERVEVLALPHNVGKAEAVRLGLLRAIEGGAELVGFLDADLSAPPASVDALVDALDHHPESWMALGSRIRMLGHRIERSASRHYLGRVFATCASLALDLPVYDTQCGCKLLRARPEVAGALSEPFLSQWIFDVELIARLRSVDGAGAENRFREVPLEEWSAAGGSRLRLRDWLRAPLELWRIRRRYPTRR